MKFNLGDVQETMLIPLVIRANETARPNARINDYKAVEIMKNFKENMDKFDKFLSHEGVISRTLLFDREVKEYIKKYPNAICVNLGCGLDNRFERVDNGQILWYDIDLKDVIEVRKNFFDEKERVKMIIGSVLEREWTKYIPKNRKIIFIAEGLFMYFSKEQVTKILNIMSDEFENFVFLVELMPKFSAKMTKHHDTVKNTNAKFGWGVDSGYDLEILCKNMKLKKDLSFNIEMKKYTIRGFLFANLPFIKNINDRLAVFEYQK